MSDTDNKSGKPLGLRGGGDRSHVRQSFSHGRTKSVVVETKRKRVVVPKPGAATPAPAPGATTTAAPGGAKSQNRVPPTTRRPAGISDAEMERRLAALKAAKERESEEAAAREEEARKREAEREEKRAEKREKERSVPPAAFMYGHRFRMVLGSCSTHPQGCVAVISSASFQAAFAPS